MSRATSDVVTQRQARIRYLRLAGTRALEELERRHRAVCEAYSEEALHDLRVAARRVRALLDLVGFCAPGGKRRKAERSVRRLLRATNPLRDADVQAERVSRRFARVERGPERAALEHLVSTLDARRLRRRDKALSKLGRVPSAEVVVAVRAAVARAVHRLEKHGGRAWPEFVHRSIRASMDRALLPLPETDDAAAAEYLHGMRIAAKRLRYTLDLLRPMLDEPAPEVFESLKRLQRLLGEHHDLALLAARVDKERVALERAGSTLLVEGIEHELARIARERKKVFQALRVALVSEGQSDLRKSVEASLPRVTALAAGPGLKTVRSAPALRIASGS